MKVKVGTIIFVFSLFLAAATQALAGFDWGGSGSGAGGGGTGSFEQQIEKGAIVEVGEIPEGLADVEIYLICENDVDVQLYDKATGEKIVAWPDGILNGSSKESTNYHGVTITYSGYNGDGNGYGHEYIKITGTTNRELVMKAFGFASGYATVNYSWGGGDCGGGSGSFEQQIENGAIVEVGEIPEGLTGVEIYLICENDVDVQLYDKATGEKIVAWPDGILNGSSKESTNYHGVTITYSGYNGDGNGLGHEYIKITGTTNRDLVMKAFGFASGYATVNYSWGGGDCGGGNDNDGGSGSFSGYVGHHEHKPVGGTIAESTIPTGIPGVKIILTANVDVDVELWSTTGDFVVGWLSDHGIDGPSEVTGVYNGDIITWSGYNGIGGNKGKESITISGVTKNSYVMKVFGFQAGDYVVEYSWGHGQAVKNYFDALAKNLPIASEYDTGTKHLGFIGANVGLGAQFADLVDVGVTLYNDLDDYFALSPEGSSADGWVTIHIRGNGSFLSAGTPVTLGILPRKYDNSDPNLQPDRPLPWEVSFFNVGIPFVYKVSAFNIGTEEGAKWSNIGLVPIETPSISLISAYSGSLNFEMKREYLDIALQTAAAPGISSALMAWRFIDATINRSETHPGLNSENDVEFKYPVRFATLAD